MSPSDKMMNIWRVPMDWAEETVVILGGGGSLTAQQVEYIFEKDVRVIAINDAYLVAPWADLLYGCDAKWWKWHNGAPDFNQGIKVGLRYYAINGECEGQWTEDLFPDIKSLAYTKPLVTDDPPAEFTGISVVPGVVRSGKDSGYQAIQLAMQLGATRIILLGYDMKSESVDLSRNDIIAVLEQVLAPDYPPLMREAIAAAMADIKIPHWHGHHPDNVPPPFDLMLKQYQGMDAAIKELDVEVINCSASTDLHEFREANLGEII